MVLYVGGWREVCCGVERRGMEGGLCGIVCGGGGRSVVVLYVERWREVCCGIVCGGGGRFVVVLYVGGWR